MQNIDDTSIIKANYYDLIITRNEQAPLKIINDHQKEQYTEVYKELIDLSKKKVQCLTKEETDAIRKYIGVGGKIYTDEEIASFLDILPLSLERKIENISKKLYRRILRGFVDLEEAVLKGKISKDELLELPVDILYELSPRLRNTLSRMRVENIGDVIKYAKRDYKRMHAVGEKTLNQLVIFIHKLGLNFKDEEPIKPDEDVEEWNKYVGFEKYMSQMDLYTTSSKDKEEIVKLKLLVSRLKKLDEQEKSYDEQIKKILLKKEELQKAKEELLTNMLEETYQKKIGEMH